MARRLRLVARWTFIGSIGLGTLVAVGLLAWVWTAQNVRGWLDMPTLDRWLATVGTLLTAAAAACALGSIARPGRSGGALFAVRGWAIGFAAVPIVLAVVAGGSAVQTGGSFEDELEKATFAEHWLSGLVSLLCVVTAARARWLRGDMDAPPDVEAVAD